MSRSRQPASLGGSRARAVLCLVRQGARQLGEHGTLRCASAQMSRTDLDARFSRRFAR